MKIEMITQNNITGTAYDISELVSNITWVTSMLAQPGKLTFNFVDEGVTYMQEGSPLSLKIDGQGVFFGFVFKRTKRESNIVSVVAYDQLRYLKNKDTYVLGSLPASTIFSRICTDYKLKYKVVDASTYSVPARVHDGKSLFEVMQSSIDDTLIYSGNWYLFRDNFGTLEFIHLNTLKTTLYIGDLSVLTGYEFESSIDEDTYNVVKLVHENKTSGKRDLYIVKDSEKIRQWGTLQYFEKMDENANEAQIRSKAEKMLALKNRPTQKFKLQCLGHLGIAAGSGVIVGIKALEVEGIQVNRYFMVQSCTHHFSNELHMMELELKVTI